MESCQQFGELADDLAEKVKYAKWRFVEIAKAVKERRPPAPPRGMEDGAEADGAAPPPPETAAPPAPPAPSAPDASGYDSMIPPPAAPPPSGSPDYMGLPPAEPMGYPGGVPQYGSQPPAAVPTAPPVSHGVPSFGIPSPPGGVPTVPQHVPPAYGAPPQMPSAMMGAVPGFKPERCAPRPAPAAGAARWWRRGGGSRRVVPPRGRCFGRVRWQTPAQQAPWSPCVPFLAHARAPTRSSVVPHPSS